MSKAVLISIRPKWCEKIINGDKTIEVRKTRPKMHTPFKCYIYCTIGGQDLSAPLIGQLGKNYKNGLDKLITGDELLQMACDRLSIIQMELGGRFVYLECEDVRKLREFYERNHFFEFDRRDLDADETDLKGKYLVQLMRYLECT